MSFNDFVPKYNLKNKKTSVLFLYEVLKKIGLESKVGIYFRDGSFSSNIGIVKNDHQKEHIGFVKEMKITLIVMEVSVHRNYLNLL